MYSYIRGILTDVEENLVVIEAGGIGYNIYTTAQTFDYLPSVGEELKLYTYLNVREDAMLLYGFLTKDEYTLHQFDEYAPLWKVEIDCRPENGEPQRLGHLSILPHDL